MATGAGGIGGGNPHQPGYIPPPPGNPPSGNPQGAPRPGWGQPQGAPQAGGWGQPQTGGPHTPPPPGYPPGQPYGTTSQYGPQGPGGPGQQPPGGPQQPFSLNNMMGGIFNQGRNAGQNGNPPSSGPGKFLGMTKKGWMIGIAAFLIVPMIPGLIMAGIAIKGMNDVQNVDTGQAQCQEWNTTREDFYRSSGIDIGKKAGCEDTLPELSGRVTPGPGSTPLTPVNPGTTPGVTPAPNPNNAYCDALKEQNDALPGTQFDVPLPAECK